ncbi:hypothetical protein B296_00026253 [Ensete ventricosum]|uniref:Uncharacterized protein n=1 Tax=Ensete ventricosum TaxID=4639 RepID=A0A427A1E0_ENSVE|nr:hypothetical protein B296_00026253 [Ensete ventricosum]
MKKYDGHKLYAKSHALSYEHGFTKDMMIINFAQSRTQILIGISCPVSEIQNTSHSQRVNPWKSYKHSFKKQCDGHKLCAKSSFDQFFMHHLRNSKY